jgi:hypothetical protein
MFVQLTSRCILVETLAYYLTSFSRNSGWLGLAGVSNAWLPRHVGYCGLVDGGASGLGVGLCVRLDEPHGLGLMNDNEESKASSFSTLWFH